MLERRTSVSSSTSSSLSGYRAYQRQDQDGGNLKGDGVQSRTQASSVNTISSVLAVPHPISLASSFSSTLANSSLNPLRPAVGRSSSSRSKAPPPIQLAELPKVNQSDFDAYIAEVQPEWERWQRNLAMGRDGHASIKDAELAEYAGSDRGRASTSDSDHFPPASIGDPKALGSRPLPPLEDVPQIYFDPEFHLANPRTFDIVTERGDAPSLPGSPTAFFNVTSGPFSPPILSSSQPLSLADLATDQILQEKLSHYLDTVELHLIREISLRSSSFFSALSNLQSLHSQSSLCLERVVELKKELLEVDDGLARKGLQIVRSSARRKKVSTLMDSMERVREVWSAVEDATEAADSGEWQGALDLIEEVEDLWAAGEGRDPQQSGVHDGDATEVAETVSSETSSLRGKRVAWTTSSSSNRSTPILRLPRIKALSSLPQRLANLRISIGRSLRAEVVSVLMHELGRNLPGTALAVNGSQESAPVKDKDLESTTSAETRARVEPLLGGIVRTGGTALEDAITGWREALLRELRKLIQEHLPPRSAEDDDDDFFGSEGGNTGGNDRDAADGRRHPMGEELRQLSHEAFLGLARKAYSSLLRCIEIVNVQSKVVLDILRHQPSNPRIVNLPGSSDTAPSLSDQDVDAVYTAALTDVVYAAAELANARFSKIISARSENHASLGLSDFLAIFDESWRFVVDCETISRRMIVGLRGTLVSQAKSFLQAFHARHITDSAKVVEEEQWAAVDIPPESQHNVDLIVDGAMEDPPELRLQASNLPSSGVAAAVSPAAAQSDNNGDTGHPSVTTPAKHLSIEGRNYFVVSACLRCFSSLIEYLKVVINLSLLTTDAMNRVIEFMKQFNSRTCQVVLGAGAMRSAGLKNITAKHLALASQSLSVMIVLIPYIRETVRRHLNPKQAVMLIEFDKLKRDYQEHQYEIHAKLVAIMGDRLAVHCKTLQAIDWEQPSNRPNDSANAYMETLVKETATLHKVLSKYLQSQTLEIVMMQVFSTINSRLAEEYSKIELRSEAAKSRLLEDAHFMKTKFAEFKGLERAPPGSELENLVLSKPTPASASKSTVQPVIAPRKTLSALKLGLARRNAEAATAAPQPTPSPARETSTASPVQADPSTPKVPDAEQPQPKESDLSIPDVIDATSTEDLPAVVEALDEEQKQASPPSAPTSKEGAVAKEADIQPAEPLEPEDGEGVGPNVREEVDRKEEGIPIDDVISVEGGSNS